MMSLQHMIDCLLCPFWSCPSSQLLSSLTKLMLCLIWPLIPASHPWDKSEYLTNEITWAGLRLQRVVLQGRSQTFASMVGTDRGTLYSLEMQINLSGSLIQYWSGCSTSLTTEGEIPDSGLEDEKISASFTWWHWPLPYSIHTPTALPNPPTFSSRISDRVAHCVTLILWYLGLLWLFVWQASNPPVSSFQEYSTVWIIAHNVSEGRLEMYSLPVRETYGLTSNMLILTLRSLLVLFQKYNRDHYSGVFRQMLCIIPTIINQNHR